MDKYDRATRSRVMSRIRARNTKPELRLRRLLWESGVRGYRLHSRLPGSPDIVFTKLHIAVFVDGCFWHSCTKCRIPVPASNRRYWTEKLARNVERDRKTRRKLRRTGWKVLRFWEHQITKSGESCAERVVKAVISARAAQPGTPIARTNDPSPGN